MRAVATQPPLTIRTALRLYAPVTVRQLRAITGQSSQVVTAELQRMIDRGEARVMENPHLQPVPGDRRRRYGPGPRT